MTEVPKIVRDRLRAGLPDQSASGPAHPDADLLTALAEQALAGAERDGVLEHLALCEDCRKVVALALPEEAVAVSGTAGEDRTAIPARVAKQPERSGLDLFAGPTLRWAALAAGVAFAASVLLLRSNRPDVDIVSSLFPASVAPSPTVPIQKTQPPMDQISTFTRTGDARARSEAPLFKKFKTGQDAAAPAPAELAGLIADKTKDTIPATRPLAAPPAGTRAFDDGAPAGLVTTQTGEVNGAGVAVEAAPSAEGNLMARNEAPAVEKAKPAPQGLDTEQQKSGRAQTQAAAASAMVSSLPLNSANMLKLEPLKRARNVTWTITGGILQRSTDTGQSWQNAVRTDHPLLCYGNHDEDVWTGGQAGRLFHSADSGLTWVRVKPSVKGRSLSADITGIVVRDTAEVVVSTSSNETWSTANGGKTWEKK